MREELPSHFSGTPEDWDAYLCEVMADDVRLRFYQWIGAQAVAEAVSDVKENLRNDPVPAEYQHYDAQTVEELLDVADPVTYPSKLPLGKPFCGDAHHTHTGGGSRMPTCRLDSPG